MTEEKKEENKEEKKRSEEFKIDGSSLLRLVQFNKVEITGL